MKYMNNNLKNLLTRIHKITFIPYNMQQSRNNLLMKNYTYFVLLNNGNFFFFLNKTLNK